MALDDVFGDNLLKFLRNKNIFGGGENYGGTPPFNPDPSQSVLPALRGTNSDKRYGTGENLFGQTNRTGSVTGDTSDNVDKFDSAARMRELYQPETGMSERYTAALDEMPERNKPGLLRKIFAGMAAVGQHPENAERVLYAPYERQLEDWKNKISPLAQASNIERQNNANLRMVANQILSGELGEKRIQRMTNRDKVLEEQGGERIRQGDERIAQGDERIRIGDERLSQGEKRIKQSDERIKIARLVANGGQFKVDDSGNAFIVKRDGSTVPVDGNYLSFEEKEGLRAQTAGAAVKARESNKRDRIVERVIEDPNNPGSQIRVAVNLDTQEVTPLTVKKPKEEPGGAPSERPKAVPPKSEGEQGKGVVNKAQRIKNSNSKWNKWIKIDKGRVDITRPGIFSGPSEEEYNQIYQSIFGEGSLSAKPGAVLPKPAAKVAKPGTFRIVGPNGESGAVPIGTDLSKYPGWKKE